MNLRAWQLIDSAFPSGGFAHSSGLEACVQHGHVDADGVRAFARQALVQCGRSSLPLVTAAHRRSRNIAELDGLCDVFLSNPIANRASRAQGRALLTGVSRSFETVDVAVLETSVRSEAIAGHYAPLFGRIFHLLEIDDRQTRNAFLFVSVRGVTSAAVRLGLVGTYEAQTIQAEVMSHIHTIADECGALAPEEIAQTTPLIDLFQSTQDRLYSRLFQS